ncbi:MAG: tetraacyldisaccharide 4'-kinase, partial [Campylobacterales bacterium]|nr:tetraacyldisaccharide 4'-kinase [Campylobacterales bacterium]
MKKSLVFWVEKYFYNSSLYQKIISFLLSPFSYLYCFIMWVRFKNSKPIDFGIPIIGVGNLIVGGSGKTPLVCALASKYQNSAILLRGYGRKSMGVQIVSDGDTILCDVETSGDEARIYADKLPSAIVIVSEDRKKGILKAKEMGASVVFLDDAYSKHNIKKIDIVIDVDVKNRFCLPSGPYRERLWNGKEVIVLKDGIDFKRVVDIKNPTKKMSLVTA